MNNTSSASEVHAPTPKPLGLPSDRIALLGRSLQPRHVALITLGGVIGAGLFVGSSASIRIAGPAVVLSYLAAGAIVYAVMLVLSAMAQSNPGKQAFTDLVRDAAGDGIGFQLGWLYWYLWVIVLSIEALAGAAILHSWIAAPLWLLSSGLVLLLMSINLLPTRSFGEFEFWFSSVKVLAILSFIAYSAWACLRTQVARDHAWINLSGLPGGFMPHGWASVLVGVVSVFFSLTGAELTTIAAAEARSGGARMNSTAAMLVSRIILFYVASILLIVCLIPWTSVIVGTSPFTSALSSQGISWGGIGMTVVVLTAVLSCMNSAFFISSRVLFGLAAHGDAPRYLVHLTPRRVPRRSVVLISICAMGLLILATLAPESAFGILVNASGSLILYIYSTVCVVFLLGRGSSRLRSIAAIAVVAMFGVAVGMACDPSLSSQLYASTMAVALVAIAAFIRHRARIRSKATSLGPTAPRTK